MPGKVLILNILGIVLQYTFLALLYYFLFRVTKMIYADLRNSTGNKVSESAPSSSQPVAKIIIIKPIGADIEETIFNLGENTSIGRSEHNDIVVTGSFVSHEHACITYYKNQYYLSDLGSTNGTYLNDEKILAEVPLKDGDVIQIGSVTFKFER